MAADDNLDATLENYDDVLVTLLGDIATNYAQVRIFQAEIAYTKANVELQRSILVLVKARFAGGQVTALDVDQAQSVLSQTESQIPALEINLRQTNNALCVLLGIAPQDLVTRIGRGPIPTAPAEVAIGVPADLIRRRPDVRMAERQAAAQAEQIGIAEAEFYPHIYLNGTVDYSAQAFRNVFNQRALQATVGPTFQWNVLNFGRILNNVRAQDALFQQLVAQYQFAVVTAAREVENGLISFLKSQEQTQKLNEAVTAAQRAVDIAIVQYKGGMIDFNRVATLEQNLVQYQNLLAQARGGIATGLIGTYRALGGGWDYRLDPGAADAPGLGDALAARGNTPAEPVPAPNPFAPGQPAEGPADVQTQPEKAASDDLPDSQAASELPGEPRDPHDILRAMATFDAAFAPPRLPVTGLPVAELPAGEIAAASYRTPRAARGSRRTPDSPGSFMPAVIPGEVIPIQWSEPIKVAQP
jgi:outer membrane protein TolC